MPTTTSHFQFLRRSGRHAAPGARTGAARSRRAARRRHVGDGDQPPVEDVRGHAGTAPSPDIRELAGVPSNYQVLMLQGGASLQFSMVPMNLLGAGTTADYIDTGTLGGQGDRRRPRRSGTVNVTGLDQGRQVHPHSRTAARCMLTPGRRVRPHHDQQHDRGHRVEDAAGRRRRAARRRRLVRHPQRSDRRFPFRPDLRRCPEEPWPVRRDAGHHSRGSARPVGQAACRRC